MNAGQASSTRRLGAAGVLAYRRFLGLPLGVATVAHFVVADRRTDSPICPSIVALDSVALWMNLDHLAVICRLQCQSCQLTKANSPWS